MPIPTSTNDPSKTIAQPRQAPPPPATAEVNLNGIKILLVEDDAMTSLAIAFALERFGATVVPVCSAAEALAQLTQELPDLLISDIGLPDTNGYDLIRQIRALSPEQGGQLPAIALLGYADPQTVAAAEEAGFQTHLSKPVDIDQLVICVSGFPKSP